VVVVVVVERAASNNKTKKSVRNYFKNTSFVFFSVCLLESFKRLMCVIHVCVCVFLFLSNDQEQIKKIDFN